MDTSFVVLPKLTARPLELCGLLLGELGPLFRGRCGRDGRLQIAFEPCIEACVILALERRALLRETVGHGSEHRRTADRAADRTPARRVREDVVVRHEDASSVLSYTGAHDIPGATWIRNRG